MFGNSSEVRTEEELGEKIKQGATKISIEGDLVKKIIKINIQKNMEIMKLY